MVRYDSSVRFEVEFTCAHGCFNEGDTTEAGLALIAEWHKQGKIAMNDTLRQYIDDKGLGEMFASPAVGADTDAEVEEEQPADGAEAEEIVEEQKQKRASKAKK